LHSVCRSCNGIEAGLNAVPRSGLCV
jgi:hypothetical protein